MTRLVLTYWAERIATPRVVFVSAVVAAAAQAGQVSDGRTFTADLVLAFALVAQFRMWDDLADRDRDAVAHPQRALVRAARISPFVTATIALAAANLLAVYARGLSAASVAALAGVTAVLGVWYTIRSDRTVIGEHLVLAKYPALVCVLASSKQRELSLPLMLSMASVFLAACLHEALHDRASLVAAHPWLCVCEAVLLAVTLAAWSIAGAS